MTWFEWLILILATARMTRLFVADDIMEWFRNPFIQLKEEDGTLYAYPKGKGVRKFIGSLLSCYWCTSVWVAVFFFIGFWFLPSVFFPIFLCLSIAYGAAFVESVSRRM